MLVEFRGPPFQETPWAIPYIPFSTHHTIPAFPLQWIRSDPPETHEIIMKSIIFVGENTWTSHFLSPVFVTELAPKILHETGREKMAETSTGAQVASEFYVLLEGSGAHPGVLQWFSAFHGISSVGSWKKSPENEIFYPAKMILQLFFGENVDKDLTRHGVHFEFPNSELQHPLGFPRIAVSQENDRHFFRWVFPMRSSYQRGQQTGRWISCCAGPWTSWVMP